VNFNDEIRNIRLLGPIMIKQQRKKVDGGGFNEFEQISCLFVLVNNDVQQRYDDAIREKNRRAEVSRQEAQAAAKAKAEAEQKRLAEEAAAKWARHLAEYLARQQERLRGAQFEDLCIHADSVTVKFSGDIELRVELHDREDPCDVYSEASISVVIGGEKL
jgi:FKBP-type peptidyl-prolyl cis-trans isomerase